MNQVSEVVSKPIVFRFASLRDIGFYLQDEDKALPLLKDRIDDLSIDIDTGAKLNSSNKQVVYRVELTYYFDSNNGIKDNQVLRYKAEVKFNIDNFDEVFEKTDNGRFQAPVEVSTMMIGVAISTIRRVLISKTSNSYFSEYPLPVIPPSLITKVKSYGSSELDNE